MSKKYLVKFLPLSDRPPYPETDEEYLEGAFAEMTARGEEIVSISWSRGEVLVLLKDTHEIESHREGHDDQA